MLSFKAFGQKLNQTSQVQSLPAILGTSKATTLKRLRGGFLLAIGWLLSPLCWWNDLIFNLPVAYFFGWICSLVSSNWLIPGTIAGYWLTNIVGILLMQAGSVDLFQGQSKERNRKKELLTGLVTSTVFTVAVLALVHFQILDMPTLFSAEPSTSPT